jgi:hypothetical protein
VIQTGLKNEMYLVVATVRNREGKTKPFTNRIKGEQQ